MGKQKRGGLSRCRVPRSRAAPKIPKSPLGAGKERRSKLAEVVPGGEGCRSGIKSSRISHGSTQVFTKSDEKGKE